MLRTLASVFRGADLASPKETPPFPDHAEVERRRRVLREAVLGFSESPGAAGLRAELARRGFNLRVDDITREGVSGWAPVNTWALYPEPRREIWMVYRDRDDPSMSDAHVFATLDNATLLAATLMPTELPGKDEALVLRTEFSLVRHQSDYDRTLRENARACLDGSVPGIWSTPSRWSVPEKAWLAATDESSITGTLAGLLSGMVLTLEAAGPAPTVLAA